MPLFPLNNYPLILGKRFLLNYLILVKLSKSWGQFSDCLVKYEEEQDRNQTHWGCTMKTTANHSIECSRPPVLSSRNQGWENILVEQFQHSSGEGKTYYSDEHSLCLSLAPRPVGMFQTQGDKTHTGAYAEGDFCLTPARMPFFARWDSDDRFLQIDLLLVLSTVLQTKRLELIPIT